MNAVIDFCEKLEATGYSENDRQMTVLIEGREVTLFDVVTSAWAIPENLRYNIIRSRHEQGDDLPYVMEISRVITAMAHAAAELVDAKSTSTPDASIRSAIDWYKHIAVQVLVSKQA